MLSSTLALSLAALLPTTFAAILEVSVGANGQLAYDPPFVHAAAGDIVRFTLFVHSYLIFKNPHTDAGLPQ
jgi:plastocyanin